MADINNEKSNTLLQGHKIKDTTKDSASWKIPMIVQETGEVYQKDFRLITNLLVTGATGFGKTSFVLSMIANIMNNHNPSDVGFIIYDSKCADYSCFDKSPFLLIPVINDVKSLGGNKLI